MSNTYEEEETGGYNPENNPGYYDKEEETPSYDYEPEGTVSPENAPNKDDEYVDPYDEDPLKNKYASSEVSPGAGNVSFDPIGFTAKFDNVDDITLRLSSYGVQDYDKDGYITFDDVMAHAMLLIDQKQWTPTFKHTIEDYNYGDSYTAEQAAIEWLYAQGEESLIAQRKEENTRKELQAIIDNANLNDGVDPPIIGVDKFTGSDFNADTTDPNSCAIIHKLVRVSTPNNQAAYLYKGPGNSRYSAIVEAGKEFIVIARQNGYLFTTYNGGGWIHSNYVVELSNLLPKELRDYTSISNEDSAALQEFINNQNTQNEAINFEETEQERIYADYVELTYGTISTRSDTDLLVNNLNGIYGIPYQFPAFVDKKLPTESGGVGSFGTAYADRIISRMPLLMLSPGKVDFLSDYTDKEKFPIIGALLSGSEADTTLSSFIEKPGKYYTFSYNSVEYWKYVNTMNMACALYLGIGDVELNINDYTAAAKDFLWENATNEKFGNWVVTNEDYVCFYADATSTKNEDFSNSTTSSQIADKVNSFSDLAKEVRFVMGAAAGAKFSLLEEDNIGNVQAKIDEIADSYLGGSRLFSDLGKDFAVIAAGGKLCFPEIWSDSEFSQSFDVNIKLRCPCPNPVQWFLDIIVPLNHLIAFVMPRTPYGKNTLGEQFDNVASGYMSPFLVRAFYRGLFNCDMGIITSLSITKGKEGSWTLNGLPTEVDVSLTIKDLYNVMVMTCQDTPTTFMSNTCFLNYLSNACGISISKMDIDRSIELYTTVYKHKIVNTVTGRNFWNGVIQGIQNKTLSIYSGLFKG